MSTLSDKAKKIAEGYDLAPNLRPALVMDIKHLARDYAERALRRWVAVRYGEWWKPEGHTYRVIDCVPSTGPGSPAFTTDEAAQAQVAKIIAEALAAAE